MLQPVARAADTGHVESVGRGSLGFALVAFALGLSACASPSRLTAATPSPFPGVVSPAESAARAAAAAVRQAVVESALALRGAAYRLGGAEPSGFDCSGLVRYVFGQHQVALPRTVAEQAREGRRVALDAIAAGDLLFFSIGDHGPTHVGIAVDGERFVHAPGTGQVVRLEAFRTPYWRQHFSGAKRIALTSQAY